MKQLQVTPSEFIKMQQDIIDRELLEMPPEDVNDILSMMKAEEAFDFLGRLGHLRADQIYRETF